MTFSPAGAWHWLCLYGTVGILWLACGWLLWGHGLRTFLHLYSPLVLDEHQTQEQHEHPDRKHQAEDPAPVQGIDDHAGDGRTF